MSRIKVAVKVFRGVHYEAQTPVTQQQYSKVSQQGSLFQVLI